MDTSIRNLLQDHVRDTLQDQMIDLVDSTDSPLGLVKSGKLQADPTVTRLNLLVREGGDEYPDILLPRDYAPVPAPVFELGGGQMWLRRFTCFYELFYLGESNRDAARSSAYVIFSRFAKVIREIPMSGLSDTFGEAAILVRITKQVMREGGGPGSFIWRGEHYIEFLTEMT